MSAIATPGLSFVGELSAALARLYVEATGLRRAPAAIMERLYRGEQVDQGSIYFRTVPRFETSDPEFAWAMQSIFLCAGTRHPDRVVLRFFEVT